MFCFVSLNCNLCWRRVCYTMKPLYMVYDSSRGVQTWKIVTFLPKLGQHCCLCKYSQFSVPCVTLINILEYFQLLIFRLYVMWAIQSTGRKGKDRVKKTQRRLCIREWEYRRKITQKVSDLSFPLGMAPETRQLPKLRKRRACCCVLWPFSVHRRRLMLHSACYKILISRAETNTNWHYFTKKVCNIDQVSSV